VVANERVNVGAKKLGVVGMEGFASRIIYTAQKLTFGLCCDSAVRDEAGVTRASGVGCRAYSIAHRSRHWGPESPHTVHTSTSDNFDDMPGMDPLASSKKRWHISVFSPIRM